MIRKDFNGPTPTSGKRIQASQKPSDPAEGMRVEVATREIRGSAPARVTRGGWCPTVNHDLAGPRASA